MAGERRRSRWARPWRTRRAEQRDRMAVGCAIRGLRNCADLAQATALILGRAAWLLHADSATLVRHDDAHVADASAAPTPPDARSAEIEVPVMKDGRVWATLVVRGARGRLAPDGRERLAPFADLISLAATTFEDRSRLASLAGTDPLTGLGNRRTFDALLSAEVERARRGGEPLSLILLDIDHFKAVNDRFGHQHGDRVLAEVGRRLVSTARGGEAVTRIGGEEFAWILPRTPGEEAENAAARALRAVGETPFEEIGTLTMSAGVCDLGHGAGAQDVVRHADQMLYRAKADGRNTFRRSTAEMEPAKVA